MMPTPIPQGRRLRECGSSLVEFSLLVTFLMLLFFGVVDLSMAVSQSMALSAAAQAAARYGASDGYWSNTAAMATAAATAAPTVSGMTVTASNFCACSAGGTLVSCSTVCNTYDLPLTYVQVQTSASIPLLFHVAGLPLNIQMSSTATLRAR